MLHQSFVNNDPILSIPGPVCSIFDAANSGDVSTIVTILDQYDCDLSWDMLVDFRKCSPLHQAAQHGHEEVCRTLLDRLGEEGQLLQDRDGWTPVMVSSCSATMIDLCDNKYGKIR